MSRQVKGFLYGMIGIVLRLHSYLRVSTFKCLKENSKEFVIFPATYYDSGEANLSTELNIINARAAGIDNVDIYFSPCVKPSTEYELCGNASGSITKVLNYLNDNNIKFGKVWLYVTYASDDCENLNGWDKDNKTSNVNLLSNMTRYTVGSHSYMYSLREMLRLSTKSIG
uniref:Uncharacterized protein n=1 Tax=Meloidogyne incognita TaxID=6306 RepID=A0A914KYD4_MELIC